MQVLSHAPELSAEDVQHIEDVLYRRKPLKACPCCGLRAKLAWRINTAGTAWVCTRCHPDPRQPATLVTKVGTDIVRRDIAPLVEPLIAES